MADRPQDSSDEIAKETDDTVQAPSASAAAGADTGSSQAAEETAGVESPQTASPEGDQAVEVETVKVPEQAAGAAPIENAEKSAEQSAGSVEDEIDAKDTGAVTETAGPSEQAQDENFAQMVEASQPQAHSQEIKVGDKVSGVVVKMGPENSFIDFGGRSEGVIKSSELHDPEGKALFGEGEPIELFVLAADDEIQLTRSLSQSDSNADLLYQAFKAGIPIEGKVTTANKWGLGVEIQGVRAFCPVSQIDSKYVESTEEYRGQTFSFKIIRFRDQGRNVVVSRRVLLEEESQKEGNAVRSNIGKGKRLTGTVTRLESFGAFVDLGAGVEGMVHVSELRHERTEHPKDVLEKGQSVEVEVLRVKDLGDAKKERISLSMKATEKDPWEEATAGFQVGSVVEGKVDGLEDFGAFVELAENVRGLVHVSEIAEKRIAHPKDAVAVGDQVKVAILELDNRRRRLRLSIKQADTVEASGNLREFQQRQKEQEESNTGNALTEALRRAQLTND